MMTLAANESKQTVREATAGTDAHAKGKDAEIGTVTPPHKRRSLPSPQALRERHPLSRRGEETTLQARQSLRRILRRDDPRLAVVVGPCSIHDTDAALDYARRLAALQSRVSDRLLLVMRVYLEKPRTTVGWRGLLNDPHLDGSFDMYNGLHRSRALLRQITDLGLPTATELLDLHAANYLTDMIAFAAIGARTTESQPHRALVSGLSLPVGFKNNTDGGLQTALDALVSANSHHSYIGADEDGYACEISTAGNPDTLLILRGGKQCGPNHNADCVRDAQAGMEKIGFRPSIMVDCSHANSGYDHTRQQEVCESVVRQRQAGNKSLVGIMIESNLHAGKQPLTTGGVGLKYGVSVTDACIDWDTTEDMLLTLAASV